MKRLVALILGLAFLVAGSGLAGAADIRGTYEGTATAILPAPGSDLQNFDLNATICEVFDGLFRATFQVVGDEPVMATGFISVDKNDCMLGWGTMMACRRIVHTRLPGVFPGLFGPVSHSATG